jgi:hypothetical protein
MLLGGFSCGDCGNLAWTTGSSPVVTKKSVENAAVYAALAEVRAACWAASFAAFSRASLERISDKRSCT